jgi:hypothetical protein
MTPQEKALELINKYDQMAKDFTRGVSMKEFAKECAILTCNEVLGHMGADRGYEFWSEVKLHLEKL